MKKLILIVSFLLLNFYNLVLSQIPEWSWVKSIPNADYCRSVADQDGNVYLVGRFSSPNLTIDANTFINAGGSRDDIVIVKYDASGNVLWARTAGGSGTEYPTSAAVDDNGDLYVTGLFESSTIDFGGTVLSSSGGPDLFIVKYNTAGHVVWALDGIGSGNDAGRSIAVDASGNVYVAGTFFSATLQLGSVQLINSSSADMFLVKYNSSGDVLWATNSTGDWEETPLGLAVDLNGNVFVTGYFNSSIATFGSLVLTKTGGYIDMFIIKYDQNGQALWARNSLGLHTGAQGNALVTDPEGNVYVSANFDNSVSFGNATFLSSGANDILLLKFDAAGNITWGRTIGGSGDDLQESETGMALAIDPLQNIYITGCVWSSPISIGSSTYTSTGAEDFFIAKFNASGNVIWSRHAGGAAVDQTYSVSFSESGILVTGYSNAAVSFCTSQIPKSSFTAKLSNIEITGNEIVFFGNSSLTQGLECTTLGLVNNFITGGTLNWSSEPATLIPNNTGSTITVCPTVNTNYSVEYISQSGCSITDNVLIKAIDVSCGNNNTKVKMCITNPSGNQTTICVAQSAVASVLSNNPNALLGDCSAYNSSTGSDVQEEARPNEIKIYPNPSTGIVYLHPNSDKSSSIRVFDVQGRLVLRRLVRSGNNRVTLDLSYLNKGIYFIELIEPGRKQISKLVIQ